MTVYSIGLGPGDPELITLKAKKRLEESDVVVVPQSDETGRSVAKEIVLNYIDENKIMMYYFPMNNNRKELQKRYAQLAERIEQILKEGKKVSYVTMGDPTIYSTSNYLTKRLLSRGIKVKHIPGISSINAASSILALPLCVKGEDFGVYETPKEIERAKELIYRHSTTVFMKVNKKLPVLLKAISDINPQAAYLAKRIGLDGERIYNMLTHEPPPEEAYLSVAIIKR